MEAVRSGDGHAADVGEGDTLGEGDIGLKNGEVALFDFWKAPSSIMFRPLGVTVQSRLC